MKYWPVPDSYSRIMPEAGEPGSFWESRGEFHHCGIDFYAPHDSAVLAIESGHVIDQGIFTTPEKKDYWNTTYYITIKSSEGVNYKYCELSNVNVHIGDYVDAGLEIGNVGSVLNKEGINNRTPYYIRELVHSNNKSMLHLELYRAPISEVRPYSGGNFLGKDKPLSLLDPTIFLAEINGDS